MKNITVSDIKKNNLTLIYNLIYSSGKISKQEIASHLNLSLPTVTQKIVKLEEKGLVIKEGYFESSVGRRAVAYSIRSNARIAIGVGIHQNQVRILSIDLKGEVCGTSRFDIPYANREEYYKEVAYKIKDFILEQNYLLDQILGIGFAIQGLTSVDGQKITYGDTLGYTGLDISAFSRYLNSHCAFFHDAKCAAETELWVNDSISNALYLSVGNHLGGAMIANGKVWMGENGHCGAAEHMQLVPDGRECYCGARGCIETYCSLGALLNPQEKIGDFFEVLRQGDAEHMRRWDEFLNYLSNALNNLHILLDTPVILGGEISHFLVQEDLEKLQDLTTRRVVFSNRENFIQVSLYPKDSISVGAALHYIQDFINQI